MGMGAKLNSPIAGVAVGGGLTAFSLFALPKILPPDGLGGMKDTIYNNKAKVSTLLGLVAAGGLFAAKKKQSAIAAAVGAVLVGIPAIMSEMAVTGITPAPMDRAKLGFGIALAEKRGFGAPPRVTVFGNAPSAVQLMGQNGTRASATNSAGTYHPQAFGGGSF